jgi:hypothetical protein
MDIHDLLREAVVLGFPHFESRLAVWTFSVALQPRLQARLLAVQLVAGRTLAVAFDGAFTDTTLYWRTRA